MRGIPGVWHAFCIEVKRLVNEHLRSEETGDLEIGVKNKVLYGLMRDFCSQNTAILREVKRIGNLVSALSSTLGFQSPSRATLVNEYRRIEETGERISTQQRAHGLMRDVFSQNTAILLEVKGTEDLVSALSSTLGPQTPSRAT
jgi:hypothetical protein